MNRNFFLNYSSVYSWLRWVFASARGLFSSCGERGPLLIAVRGPLTIAASLVAEHRLQTRRLSSRGPRAQLLRRMRDLPRPGPEPVSPALAGRFSTTAPPGKPWIVIFNGCLMPWNSNVFKVSFHWNFDSLLHHCCCFYCYNCIVKNFMRILFNFFGIRFT